MMVLRTVRQKKKKNNIIDFIENRWSVNRFGLFAIFPVFPNIEKSKTISENYRLRLGTLTVSDWLPKTTTRDINDQSKRTTRNRVLGHQMYT